MLFTAFITLYALGATLCYLFLDDDETPKRPKTTPAEKIVISVSWPILPIAFAASEAEQWIREQYRRFKK